MNRFKVKMVCCLAGCFRCPLQPRIDLCVAQSAQEGQRRQEQRRLCVRHRLSGQGAKEERQARETRQERQAVACPAACVARTRTNSSTERFTVAGSTLRCRHLVTHGTLLFLPSLTLLQQPPPPGAVETMPGDLAMSKTLAKGPSFDRLSIIPKDVPLAEAIKSPRKTHSSRFHPTERRELERLPSLHGTPSGACH